MVSRVVTITEAQGLHMRPAGLFARAMGAFSSTVELVVDGQHVNAKSVMALIAASIKEGASVEIQCEGTDEEEALAQAVQLLTPQA